MTEQVAHRSRPGVLARSRSSRSDEPGPPGRRPGRLTARLRLIGPAVLPGWTRGQRLVLAGISLVVFAVYTTYAWARHAEYKTTGFDLGIFDQAVRAYAHFHAPTAPLKGIGYNILGDHFHPILVLLVPLYWIWADPRMLLTAQAALFAISIVPVAAFTRRRLGTVAALGIAFAYGASWPLEAAVHFDFHEIAFAVPLIALLIDALDRRAYRTVVVCCLLLLLDREDMGALVLIVGLLVVLRPPAPGRTRRPTLLLGGALMVVGVAGYWLATVVIIPALGPSGFSYWTFPALGPDPAAAVRTVLLHPRAVLRLMVTPRVKFHTLVSIFSPTAFLALLSPYVLLAAPFLAERMLNVRPELWQTNFHYSSVTAPIVAMAAVDTAGRIVRVLPRVLRDRRLRALPVIATAAFTAWCAGVVVYQLAGQASDYPLAGLWNGAVWVRDARWHNVHDTLPLIPAGQCVEADNELAPQLTGRDYVTRVTFSHGLATWIVLDLDKPDTGWQSPPPPAALRYAFQHGYEQVSQKGSIVLLHKDQPIAPLCRGLF